MIKSYAYLTVAAFGLLTACSKKEDAQPAATTTNLTATIDGSQQMPANNSTATGTFAGIYDSSNKQLTYTVTYKGFTPTIAHIHLSATGAVAIPFANLTSPITGTVTLSNDQATQLLNNGMYVNMHSAAFQNGEIRGEIKKQ